MEATINTTPIQPQVTQQTTFPTPVFDFTATINAALAQAIALATAPLVERIKYLENHSAAADNTFTLAQRITLLEEVVKHVADEDRIKEIADEAARDVMSEHVGDYDHDEYDRLFDNIGDRIDEAINEAVDDLDISDKINDALNGATVSISV